MPGDVLEIGAVEFTQSTYLPTIAEATSLATLLLYRRNQPKYSLESLTIPMSTLSDERANELIVPMGEIRPGAKIRIPQIDPDLVTDYFVEGYDDQISMSRFVRRLYVSDKRITNGVQFWQEVDETIDWQWAKDNFPYTWQQATAEYMEP